MIQKKVINELSKVIKDAKTFLIFSHINPEPDTIGSALAFYYYLNTAGKTVFVHNFDGLPKYMDFMPFASEVSKDIPDNKFDVVLSLDAGSIDMLGDKFPPKDKKLIVNVDHHRTNTRFGDLNIVDPASSATSELVYTLFRKMGIKIDTTIASLLLTGIIYDTGSFRYRNTTAKTLKIASELMQIGANITEISDKLYENQSLGRLKLLEIVLKTLELSVNGKIASIELTRQMYHATGTTKDDAEGFIDYPRSISGVAVAAMFREVDDNKYKISMRSKNDVDVSAIAQVFGGGGHKNAAGCTMNGILFDVKNSIFTAIAERLK